MARFGLKAIKETKSGLNTRFRDANGNEFTKSDFINHPSLRSRYKVHIVKRNEKTYLRSNPDGKKRTNLE